MTHTQTLIFRRTFGLGGGASVVISAASNRLPAVDFSCAEPQPPFEEIINLVKQSCIIWSGRFDRCAQFVAIFPEGDMRVSGVPSLSGASTVREGKDPSIEEALEFANHMLSAAPGDCVTRHASRELSRMNPYEPSLPRLQILTSLLAHPQELRYEHRKLTEYLPSDTRTADEFLARYGWRLRYAKAGG